MSRKGWLMVGLALVLVGTLSGPGAHRERAQDVIDEGNITEHRARVEIARWGDQGGEQGEVEAPRA